jgi:decaprenyl-phosphate phosphoribosyltransferase
MSTRTRETGGGQAQVAAAPRLAAWPLALAGMSLAAVQAARPRQWPKNLLVFAAPLAGATLGRHYGLVYALVAFAAFTAASSAVYLVNDVMDAERDQLHPAKRQRPIASGRLPRTAAMALAAALLAFALAASLTIGEPRLAGVIGAYVTVSLLYSLGLKHVPGAELAVVALGFVLRAIGGAVATHVPPSAWFLTVCSLGALMVAIGKRYTELTVLGSGAVAHRPAMRWYRPRLLRAAERAVSAVMLAAYVLWALSEHDPWMRSWHLLSAVPLAAALFRFNRLTDKSGDRPVEDLIARDPAMLCCELAWLTMFITGL